jgi:hypothetical protein
VVELLIAFSVGLALGLCITGVVLYLLERDTRR